MKKLDFREMSSAGIANHDQLSPADSTSDRHKKFSVGLQTFFARHKIFSNIRAFQRRYSRVNPMRCADYFASFVKTFQKCIFHPFSGCDFLAIFGGNPFSKTKNAICEVLRCAPKFFCPVGMHRRVPSSTGLSK